MAVRGGNASARGDLGHRVAHRRRDLGLSREQEAERAGMTPGQRRAATYPKLETLSDEECTRLLGDGGVGRFVFNTDRDPEAVPVNYRLLDGDVVFRVAADTSLAAVGGGSAERVPASRPSRSVGSAHPNGRLTNPSPTRSVRPSSRTGASPRRLQDQTPFSGADDASGRLDGVRVDRDRVDAHANEVLGELGLGRRRLTA
jgi:hypothetical protein